MIYTSLITQFFANYFKENLDAEVKKIQEEYGGEIVDIKYASMARANDDIFSALIIYKILDSQ